MLCPLNVMAFGIEIPLEFPIPFFRRRGKGGEATHPDHFFYLFEDLKFPLKLPYNPHKDNKPANNKD